MKNSIFFVLIMSGILNAQQVGDPDFNPPIGKPAYKANSGPIVLIDEAHENFHTMDGRYKAFADLLRKDGYRVEPNKFEFTESRLKKARILVIANAISKRNVEDENLPFLPAFTEKELKEIENWVKNGGSLFLIADHMPFPAASGELAAVFGFKMNNGFARDTSKAAGPDLFTRRDATLANNFITNGLNPEEFVDSIYSFTGQAFEIPKDAASVLTFNNNFISLMPDTAWVFTEKTPKVPVAGWSQGAVRKYFKGKVAVWGEAAMFTAQVTGAQKVKVGMNAPTAKNNYKLLLNIIHWLTRK